MTKTILITGATDGIGLEAAILLAEQGHRLLLHGRSEQKLQRAAERVSAAGLCAGTYLADFSQLGEVRRLAQRLRDGEETIDVVVNNAGVFQTSTPRNAAGLDIRFVVNTLAPYLLTTTLAPRLGTAGRVVNLSSAAQEPVQIAALLGEGQLPPMAAYAQSKLALTMWSYALAQRNLGPAMIALNPGSLLATKMVKDAFGVPGTDLRIGASIVAEAAVGTRFADASGKYFDNDAGQFAKPHRDCADSQKVTSVVEAIEGLLETHAQD